MASGKKRKSHGQKLAKLPNDAKITKRPLLRKPLPSPYAGSESQKVVYVGSKTPFMSVVKRVEKLLRLADSRLVQSASKLAQNDQRKKRRRGGDDDEIGAIADMVEQQKRRKDGAAEEILIKGSGKAIGRVMELGLWFQQRDDEYAVRLQTASASGIDDVEYEKEVEEEPANGGAEQMDVEAEDAASKEERNITTETVTEARIRKVSVLEVYVKLR